MKRFILKITTTILFTLGILFLANTFGLLQNTNVVYADEYIYTFTTVQDENQNVNSSWSTSNSGTVFAEGDTIVFINNDNFGSCSIEIIVNDDKADANQKVSGFTFNSSSGTYVVQNTGAYIKELTSSYTAFYYNGKVCLYDIPITYDLNGGTGTAPTHHKENGKVAVNQEITLADGTGFSRSGYSFLGWNSNSGATTGNTGSYILLNSDSSADGKNINADSFTFYAIWGHKHDGIIFDTPLYNSSFSGGTISTSGNYYLAEDITLSQPITIDSGVTVNLCLNDKVLNLNNSNIQNNGTLTIYDCGSTKHYFTVDNTTKLWTIATNQDTENYVEGGVITSGSGTSNCGGAICNCDGATLTLNGGNIVGNSAMFGGGVYNLGTFIMNGGSIIGNYCHSPSDGCYGAGVCNSKESDITGEFTLNGGVISRNNSANIGGGVGSYGTFTMTGGLITENTSAYLGSGVIIYGDTNLLGGSISGNKTSDDIINGVSVFSSDILTVGGEIVIDNIYIMNYEFNGEDETYEYAEHTILSSSGTTSLSGKANIGIILFNNHGASCSGTFMSTSDSGLTKHFHAADTNYGVIARKDENDPTIYNYNVEELYTVTYDGNGSTSGTVPIDDKKYFLGDSVSLSGNTGSLTKTGYKFLGWNSNSGSTSGLNSFVIDSSNSTSGKSTLYAIWEFVPHEHGTSEDADYIKFDKVLNSSFSGGELSSGNYYLTENITLASSIKIAKGTTVNLCLNGNVINASGFRAINVFGTLNIYDCGTTSHYYTVDSNGKWVWNDNNTTNAKEYSTLSAIPSAGDVIELKGGTITGSNNNAICVGNSETYYSYFTLNSGNIVGNSNSTNPKVHYGAGVMVDPYGTFTLNGGKVVGNFASGTNDSCGNGGGVGVYDAATNANIVINTGDISFNTARRKGGGIYNYSGTITINGGNIKYNNSLGNTTVGGGGGGIFSSTKSTLYIYGGTISNNKAISYGGGVYTESNKDFVVGGNANITENAISNNVTSNVYFKTSAKRISFNDSHLPQEGMSIGITTIDASSDDFVTTASTNEYAKYFTSDKESYGVRTSKNGNVYTYSLKGVYSVLYKENGATSGDAPSDSNKYATGEEVTIKDGSGLSKNGYKFLGWNTDKDATAALTFDNNKLTMGSSNVMLYAVWEAIPHEHGTSGNNDYIKFDKVLNSSFTGGALTDGNYYLAEDITLTQAITIASGQTVNICLNDKVLNLNNFLIIYNRVVTNSSIYGLI